jgi:photosystem II stability/assembly factor-like uncharacterized protein
MRTLFIFIALFTAILQHDAGQRITNVETHTDASFRGLSIVDDHIAWVSGSKGCVGVSVNGGKDWTFKKVTGFEKADFRTVYAFDAQTAVIANAGSPACILRTTDAGASWSIVYRNDDTAAFFDGIGFWNDKDGIIYGDPINGKMLLLRASDGGRTWNEPARRPALAGGEASFAASGTAIRCMGSSKVVIATGGAVSRLWMSGNKGDTWDVMPTPILQGEKTTGIFSVAFADGKHGIIVGGDYKTETLQVNHVFITKDGGSVWTPPLTPTGGYRECVEYIGKNTAVATGPTGTDITTDGGRNWRQLSAGGFHVVRKSRKGNLVLMAGAQGKIAMLITAR